MRGGLAGLLAANAVSHLGNVVAVVALPWYVLETTGSAARTGITAFATTVPLALGSLVAGPLVDRTGARRVSILADIGATVMIAGIPLLDRLGMLHFGILVALAFAAGACEAPGRTARRAILPSLAERAGVSLERANSVSTTSEHLGYVVGAPLAGVLTAVAGAPVALLADAASFAVSAALVAATVPAVRAAAERPPLLSGLRFVRDSAIIRTFFVIWTAGAFLVTPLSAVLLPNYAREQFGSADALAAAVTALGAGGLCGTFAFGAAARRLPRRPVFAAMWTVYPALTCALIMLPGLPALLALLAAIGFVVGAYDPLEVTIHQENVPPGLRAQVFAILLAAEMTAVPLSMLVYGFLIAAAGLRAGLILYAGGNVLLGAYAVTARAARRLDPPVAAARQAEAAG
jgi:MFS family permease